MSKIIKLNKGLDIKLEGQAASVVINAPLADTYAVSPLDFEGVTPKLLVKVGDQVKAGTPLFFNKYNERVLFTSPVSGTVEAVNRGEKRKVLSVTVKPDAEQQYEEFAIPDLSSATRDQIVGLLLKAGLWTMIIQRPYGIIADPDDAPKAIFVSAFDSAPLAPDYNFALAGEKVALQRGVEVLKKLTAGKVHVSFRAGAEGEAATLEGVELHAFAGKHPAGNVGVQIHHIDPVNKGEVVWTVNVQDLATIGRFFSTGKVDRSKVIAVTGSEVAQPQYCRIIDGRLDPFDRRREHQTAGRRGEHPLHFGQCAYGRQDLARRSYRVLCASVDADSRGRQVRVAGLGDAPLQQILRVARLFLVALPQEALQPRHQSQRAASVRSS